MKDTVFAAIVCKKCSAEQLHADGLTKVKGADILPWSAEVTAVTAFPPLGRAPSESPRHFVASMDESVIVGYYTLKKCRSSALRCSANLKERTKIYGKK